MEEVTRESIMRLMKHRDSVDEQIQALGGILSSNNIGMTEPLVDSEGFPRNDIDVYQVRHARHKIICLQNDFKGLTKEIDSKLEMYHKRLQEIGETPMEFDNQGEFSEPLVPIAKVNLVSDGSPAYHAGLKVDDEILAFGSIRVDNFTSIMDIGRLVQGSSGTTITVNVKRNSRSIKLALIPGPWNGRGLLGCNIIPIDPPAIDR